MHSLIKPNSRLEEKFINMIKDYNAHNEETDKMDFFNEEFNFEEFIRALEDMSQGINLPQRYVPSTEWWLVNSENDILGTVRVRHRLGEINRLESGHIGYDISPKYRRKGYGKDILKLALDKARELGLKKVLVTCDCDNIGSRKIIEHNGGQLESSIISKETGKPLLRYWIKI